MKKILFFLVAFAYQFANAQNVGINNPAPAAAALLDLTSTNKGLLIPRVALTATNSNLPIGASAVTSLLVYNTATIVSGATSVSPGFYYWDGLKWIRLIGASGTTGDAWTTTGNAGTADGTNFVGTTDNVPFNIKVSNQKSGRIEFNPLTANTFYGFQAGNVNVGGIHNSFFGYRAGALSDGTGHNSFFGNESGRLTTTGDRNSFFGCQTGDANTIGFRNCFFGNQAGAGNNTGSNNSFFGWNSGSGSTSGTAHTAIGVNANFANTALTNATAIGANARADASNALVLGSVNGVNSATATVNVGIGTNAPAERLEVVGLNVAAATSGSAQNAIARFHPLGSNAVLDIGMLSSPAHAWLQVRDASNYSSNFDLSLNPNGGNVGIGTNAPQRRLHISLDNTAASTVLALENTNTTNNNGTVVSFRTATTGAGATSFLELAAINAAFTDHNHSTMSSALIFHTSSGGVQAAERMRIHSNGNVGINTISPLDKLHVAGSIRMVDGNQAANKVMVSDANGTASWQNLGVITGWGITGNSGTVDGTNFIGTTDGVPFNIRVNNQKAGRIDHINHNTIYGFMAGSAALSGTFNTFVGDSAGLNNTSGSDNTLMGYRAGKLLTSGSRNTLIGSGAGRFGAANNDNTLVGYMPFFGFSSFGSNNTVLGSNGLQNLGNFNVIIGKNAGVANQSVGDGNVLIASEEGGVGADGLQNNTFIGHLSSTGHHGSTAVTECTMLGYSAKIDEDQSISIENATAIGARALANRNNTIVLGSISGVNGATASVRVGIGTTTPATKLDVNGDISIQNGNNLTWGGAYGAGIPTIASSVNDGIYFYPTGSTFGTAMKINASGRVGIGTTAPGGQLELSLDQGRKPATGTWTITSDARLKNIEGAYTKGLNEILQLQPVAYHYKNAGERKFAEEVLNTQNVGFSAQEVQKVFPEAVGTDDDGYLNFNMHAILVAYVNAVKDLKKENDDLKGSLDALLSKIQVLETKVEHLNNPANTASINE